MNLKQLRAIAPALEADLTALLAKHGLKLKRGLGASTDNVVVRFRFEACLENMTDATGAKTSPEREEYKSFATYLGLKPEWLDATITIGGEHYRIAGLRRKAKTKPVLVERLSDKSQRIAPVELIVRSFAAKAAKPIGPDRGESVGSSFTHPGARPLGELLADEAKKGAR